MEYSRIDIFMHVGGTMKFGKVVRYVCGKSEKFGAVDCDKVAYFTLVRFAESLGYASDRLWYVLPAHSLSAGLKLIRSDEDVIRMVSLMSVIGYVNVYVEGGRNDSSDRIACENDADVVGSDGRAGNVPHCVISSSSSEDTGHGETGAAAPIGTNGRVLMTDEHHDAVPEDTGHCDEAEIKKRSPSYRTVRFDPRCDPGDIVFVVGLTFDDEGQFEEAVRVHAVYSQSNAHSVRSSSMSMEAKCVDGCPWRVLAIRLHSDGKFVVKMSSLEHKCVNLRANDRIGKMGPESEGVRPCLNEGKQDTKEEVSELNTPDSTHQETPSPKMPSQPSASEDQAFSAEQLPVPSGQARLLGLRKKSEVRRGGIGSTRRGRA